MIQLRLFYLRINYNDLNDNYYLHKDVRGNLDCIQSGFDYLPDRLIYDGEKYNNTITDKTFENIIKNEIKEYLDLID